MISFGSSFLAANAGLKKKPVFVIKIAGYNRAFSNVSGANLYPDLFLVGLIGCFTDGTGQIIGQPFPIGDGPVTLRVPVGATQLQLGINDDILSDNPGSYTIDVNGSNFVVPGTTACWDWVSGGLNTAFQFGIQDGTAPVVVAFPAGTVLTIKYVSGTVGFAGFSGRFDANGQLATTGHNNGLSGNPYPTWYMPIALTPWLLNIDDIAITVSDLDGGADLSDFSFNVLDSSGALTSDLSSFVFEGNKCVLLQGFGKFDPAVPNSVQFDPAFDLSKYETLFTGKIDSVASDNNNLEYKFTVPDIRKDLTKVIYQTGDDGFPTDSSHPKTLTGHPLDILLDALENQVGYAAADIDVAGITNYRDTVFSGLEFTFTLTSPPAAKDFIENEILKVLGGYHFPNNLGIFKVKFFYPLSTTPAATLDHANLLNVPTPGQAELVNQVTFRFDESGGSSFLAESLQSWGASIAKYGLFGEQVIESAGMRSAFIGFFIAQFIARLIFLRYGDKQLVIDGVQAIWSEVALEPGDYVQLTSSLIPDRVAGTMGVTNQTFEVLGRTWSPLAGVVTLKLLAVDLSLFLQYLITPNGEADFTADTALNQATYMYQSDAAGLYSDGSPGNTLC